MFCDLLFLLTIVDQFVKTPPPTGVLEHQWPRPGVKLQNIVGGAHNPNLPTKRLRSSLICR